MSRYVYEAALGEPGAVAVTGSRWVHGALRYARVATTGRPAPVTTTPRAGVVPTDDDRRPPGPGAGPVVITHDLGKTAGFAPEGADLVAAGARWALESRFRLGDGDWAAFSVGFAERPAPADETLTTTRLVQLSEVIVASHHRITAYREHDKRQIEDAFLAEASLQMDSSLDVNETLGRVARLAVPALAEGCVVHLCPPDRPLAPVAHAHVSASVQPWLDALAREDRWFAELLDDALERQEDVVLSGDGLAGGPFGADGEGPGRSVRTVTVSPLRARGRAIGTLTFVYHRPGEDIPTPRLLSDLARRAALAIDTTTAYEQRRRHVEMLQRQLLPGALPQWPGLDLHASYEVADASLEVGGDFYDAVVDRDGRLALVIGDVCGRGAEAAAMTGLARHTLRTLLEDGVPPGLALERLNKALLDQEAPRFVTALIAVLTPTGPGECEVEIVSAGHPRPLVGRADGRVEEVAGSGLLLGVLPGLGLRAARLRVVAGDTLVMFTDGLTEARNAQGVMFEELLPQAVRDCAATPDPSAELIARASKFRTTGDDDTAVLVARLKGPR
ncbi:hypothetical protein EAO77_04650 [Streptomyces sp. t39]|nr:hypothetical protein EAO77_04650 [Streptomyces sp. t39]